MSLKAAIEYLGGEKLDPTTIIEVRTIDGMFIKGILLPKRGLYPQHSHQFDHATLIARGAVVVWEEDSTTYYKAPKVITIKAGVKHKFQTLEPDTLLFCLHNLHGEEYIKVLEEAEDLA